MYDNFKQVFFQAMVYEPLALRIISVLFKKCRILGLVLRDLKFTLEDVQISAILTSPSDNV